MQRTIVGVVVASFVLAACAQPATSDAGEPSDAHADVRRDSTDVGAEGAVDAGGTDAGDATFADTPIADTANDSGADAGTPSAVLNGAFVSGGGSGNAGPIAFSGQFVWHGAARGSSGSMSLEGWFR